MALQLQVTLEDNLTTIVNDVLGKIVIQTEDKAPELAEAPVVISFLNGKVTAIGTRGVKGADLIVRFYPKELEPVHVREQLTRLLDEKGVKTASINAERIKIPTNLAENVKVVVAQFVLVLTHFGLHFIPVKKKPLKAQHRWNKAVSEIPFYVDDFGSRATIVWRKRNEMVIKKGATMLAKAPLNKDGSIGLNQRMGEKLRDEQRDDFMNLVTTEDIILKSVNEVSLFLYFAGTNSWLVLKDQNGKTIDEYTVVK